MTTRPSRRVVSVDVLRSLAIAMALFQHSLTTYGVWPHFSSIERALVRVVADVATPAFVLVFGVMLELIYAPRMARDGVASVTRALLRRAGDCYLTYVATIAAAVLSGRRSIVQGLAATALLGNTRYGNILKFYALALPLSVLLLRVRARHGLAALVGLGASAWVVGPALGGLSWPDPTTRASYLTATLVGYPAGRSWLSLLHSIPIIVVGMLLGNRLAASRGRPPAAFYRTSLVVCAACLPIVLETARHVGGLAFVRSYLSLGFRSTHHIVYYALGLLQATGALVVLTWLWPPGATLAPRLRPLLALGQRSLLTFTVGSCILNAWSPAWRVSPGVGVLLSIALPLAMNLLAIWRGPRTRVV